MKKLCLANINEFLDFLDARKIPFTLGRQRPEAIEVTFRLVGKYVEVEFFEEDIEFSVFVGDEGVDVDQDMLIALFPTER